MQLREINSRSSVRQPDAAEHRAEKDSGAPASESRALVALAAAANPPERQTGYRDAPFLAQLIATKDLHPQTRERRRADPNEVLAAYRATVGLTAF
jgi:hypothetical protein